MDALTTAQVVLGWISYGSEFVAGTVSTVPIAVAIIELADILATAASIVLLFVGGSAELDNGSKALYGLLFCASIMLSAFVISMSFGYALSANAKLPMTRRDLNIVLIAYVLFYCSPAILFFAGGMNISNFRPMPIPPSSQILAWVAVGMLPVSVFLFSCCCCITVGLATVGSVSTHLVQPQQQKGPLPDNSQQSSVESPELQKDGQHSTEPEIPWWQDVPLLFGLVCLLPGPLIFMSALVQGRNKDFPLEAAAYFLAQATSALAPAFFWFWRGAPPE